MARQDRHKAETEESDGDALMTPMTEEGPEGLLARREMADVLERGKADAVLAASIFHFGEWSIAEAKEYMRRAGIPVR